MKEYNLTCQEEDNGIRIDRVLSEYYEELSRSYIQKLIKENLIFINGKTCKEVNLQGITEIREKQKRN